MTVVTPHSIWGMIYDVFRDLIESADKIVAIANNCGTILHNVKTIQVRPVKILTLPENPVQDEHSHD